jgi:hypothetical protein
MQTVRILTCYCYSVIIISCLRLNSLVDVSKSFDPTYDNGPSATWSALEANIAIMCACLPPLRALVVRLSSKGLLSSRGSKKTGYGYGYQNTGESWRSGRPNSGRVVLSGRGNSSKATASASEEEIIGLKDIRSTSEHESLDAHRTWLADVESAGDHKEIEAAVARDPNAWQQFHTPRAPRVAVTRTGTGTISTARGPVTERNRADDISIPLERPRSNSFGTMERMMPEGNEIFVSTRVRQTVD